MATSTQKLRLFQLLLRFRKGVTAKQAEARGVSRVPARIFDLRNEGFCIYTNYSGKRRNEYGQKEAVYRLDNAHR